MNTDFKNTLKNVKIIAKLGHCLPVDIEIDTPSNEWKIIKLNQQKMKVNRVNSFLSTYFDATDENNKLKYPNFSMFLKNCC